MDLNLSINKKESKRSFKFIIKWETMVVFVKTRDLIRDNKFFLKKLVLIFVSISMYVYTYVCTYVVLVQFITLL